MIDIDLNVGLPAEEKTYFYIDIINDYPDVVIYASLEPTGSGIRVLTENMYPGSIEQWCQSISSRLRDYLIKIYIIDFEDEDEEVEIFNEQKFYTIFSGGK